MRKPSPASAIFVALLTVGTFANRSDAAVLVTTSGTGANGDIMITMNPISFLATAPNAGGFGSFVFLVFDEAQTDGQGEGSPNILGPNVAGGVISIYTEAGAPFGDVTFNDPYVGTFFGEAFAVGDVVSFDGGTISQIGTQADLDVFPSGSYEVFLTDGNGNRLTENGIEIIPEPSAALLLGLGTVVMAGRRRRIR